MKNPETKPTNKGGAPKGSGSKKTPEMTHAVLSLTREGKSRRQIAEITGLSTGTIWNWKIKDWEFAKSLKENMELADDIVEVSMFKRANGFTHPETKVFCNNGEIITHKTTKYYPPDTEAGKFWLTNRRKDKWKVRNEVEQKSIQILSIVSPNGTKEDFDV